MSTAALVALAALAGLAGCLASEDSASGPLAGAYQVANGTRRLDCEGQAESAPFVSQVWFFGGTPVRRMDGLSSCEFKFGPREGSGEVAAEILPGQVCEDWALGEGGSVTSRQILPLYWTVRRLEDGLLWESYELILVEGEGREARRCRLSAAATLAPAELVVDRAPP